MPAKRESDTNASATSTKKAKTGASVHASAKAILADVDSGFEKTGVNLKDETAVRKAFTEIANYVSSLEDEVKELKKARAVAEAAGGGANHEKSPEQIEIEAQRLRDIVVRGIKKLLVWKPSCKTNGARYAFDGICTDPLVFGAMLQMDGPANFKQKKMVGKEFEGLVGQRIVGSARYNDLYISKENVFIRYQAQTGEFKISGSYGISSY